MNCLFKTHPIRREIIGSRKSLHSLVLNDLVEAHNLYYNLSNMIIVVTGRFLEKDLDLITNNLLSNSPYSISIEKQRFLEKSKPVRRNSEIKSGLNQTYLSMGARTVSSQHSDAHVLDLIATILGDGFSSRLFMEVREKLGLSYNISASSQCGLDYGYFSIDCSVKPKNLELTIKIIEKEVNKLCTGKVVEKELRKAKDMIRGELLRLVDRSIDFPELIVACEIKYETEYAILNYLKKIGDISSEDIIDIANKYIQSDKLSLVSLSPKED
jgi:predicted Zn-dependent peptidase